MMTFQAREGVAPLGDQHLGCKRAFAFFDRELARREVGGDLVGRVLGGELGPSGIDRRLRERPAQEIAEPAHQRHQPHQRVSRSPTGPVVIIRSNAKPSASAVITAPTAGAGRPRRAHRRAR